MAYTLNQGVNSGGLDRMQRGLLMGIPAIAVILSFGAIFHHNSNNRAGLNPQVIPIVSAAEQSSGKSTSGNGSKGSGTNGTNASASTSALTTSGTGTGSGGAALASSSPSSGVTTSSGGSTGVIGGRGGGPTGGGTTGGGSTSGGGATIPNCSIDQIATVTCQVPACSPTVTLQPGQKAILGVGGTCVVLN